MDAKLVQRLRETLLGRERYATLSTISPTGSPRGRMVTLLKLDDDLSLWFSTLKSSRKVSDIQNNPAVSLAFQTSQGSVNVEGIASLVEDPATKKELYSPAWNIFGYKGPEDPDYVLIKVAPKTVELVSGKDRKSEMFFV